MKKKASFTINDIPYLVLIVGVGIIALAITTEVVSNIQTDAHTGSSTITNESTSITIGTLASLGSNFITAISGIRNSSGEVLQTTEIDIINAGASDSQVNITNTSAQTGTFYLDYTTKTLDYNYNITKKGKEGQIKFGNWFPTIGLILGAIIVLTTLTMLGYDKFRKG